MGRGEERGSAVVRSEIGVGFGLQKQPSFLDVVRRPEECRGSDFVPGVRLGSGVELMRSSCAIVNWSSSARTELVNM